MRGCPKELVALFSIKGSGYNVSDLRSVEIEVSVDVSGNGGEIGDLVCNVLSDFNNLLNDIDDFCGYSLGSCLDLISDLGFYPGEFYVIAEG